MKKRKFKNKKVVIDGIKFDSKSESRYYKKLLELKGEGIVTNIELQPTFPLLPSFRKNGKTYRSMVYIADFEVTYSDGKVEIIDIKGRKDQTFMIKHKLFEYKYPDLELILLTDALQPGDFIMYSEYMRRKRNAKKKR